MAGPIKRLAGPLALTNTLTTNVYQGGGGSALIYDVVKHIHIINKTGSQHSVSLFLGATGANAAGTEIYSATPIAANSALDYYCNLKMASTDFLVGGADANTALTILIEGEQFVV